MGRTKKRIVILGGGFAGVKCARKLESYFLDDRDIEIVLISEDNFLLFTPMLPQVASGMIETRHAIIPIRTIIEETIFYEGRVKNIDPYGKNIDLWGTGEKRGISIEYDFLVLALGSQTNFFGLQDVEKHAYTMKTLNDAVVLRNRAIDMLEQADNEADPIRQKSMLTFVIVGGGFAGVETGGEILDLLHDARKHYPHITKDDIRVIILEADKSILVGFSDDLAKFAKEKMTKRGIDIRLETAVTSFDGQEVMIKKMDQNDAELEAIRTHTLVWTAGVTPANTIKRSMFKTDKGKILVNEFLEVPEFPGVFAIGDCALFMNAETKRPYPPTAQIAEAQADAAAKNLKSLIRSEEKKKFAFKMKGQMAVIGKHTAIGTFFGSKIAGFWAWFLWRTIYLSKIPKVDKRIRVMLDWTIDLFFDRDISRMKFFKKTDRAEYKALDEVDDAW